MSGQKIKNMPGKEINECLERKLKKKDDWKGN